MMISTFDESYANPQNSIMIQNQLSRFMSDDSDDNFNEITRKGLIVRVQKSRSVLEPLLSWFYCVTTKEFSKAFIQESHLQAQWNHCQILSI
jgi:hypothetical protein